MGKKISLVLALVCTSFIFSQTKVNNYPLLNFSGTISPGKFTSQKSTAIHLNGFLEYTLDRKYSVRGDVYKFIQGAASSSNLVLPYQMNQLYAGAFRSFGKDNWRQYIGFQPGITVSRDLLSSYNKPQINPSFSLKVGSSFSFYKYFNFFLDLSFNKTQLRGLHSGPNNLNEFLLSGGLGFQIPRKIKKVRYPHYM